MALVQCDECGRKVSTQASRCPGCGAPVLDDDEAPPSRWRMRLAGIGLAACALAAEMQRQAEAREEVLDAFVRDWLVSRN